MYNRVDIGNYYLYESKKIGSGSYGTVHLGENKSTKQMVAIKKINKNLLEQSNGKVSRLKEEALIQKRFNHRNIVKCYD